MDIRVTGLTKSYGISPALHGIDLDIKSGELLGLLGPSGSGKTTLLRIIAGLEQPSTGTVFFGTDDTSRLSVQERRVGFVFQHYALFRHMSVADNVAYGLRVRPRGKRPAEAEIVKRVADLLELVQLGAYGQRFPAQLSGGQRQRVALARALAVEPKVLLLDEPFGALDAKVRKDLRSWLRTIHDKTGHTTIFVTHDQDEALELSDRIAVLDKGRIDQLGVPDEIYDHPATPFIFGFIGESSRVPVTLTGGRIQFEGTTLPFNAEGLPDGPATLFVRPHDVAPVEPASGTLNGVVVAQRRVGATRRLEVALGAQRTIVEADLPALRAGETNKPVGLKLLNATVFAANGEVRYFRGPNIDPVVVRPPAFQRA
ncbi:sulfate/thiosulfate import ATP-binding protein CysA [Labrys miyagiensis]|uniref:Sulfate/thiosulfate import ATP-binding protein CysA n=1 Tax=Labrys miyagiensis TaxID=346912 RepID=A0ABQ6CNJ8_9HYPH|nr:sulfate/molybdate ABC transporter ATP-binding protein [Labrys miyagiensis]GLS21714.1 sulfate/thiosulfate import ATP-binding protein CysA [Labrys miyagiensis]